MGTVTRLADWRRNRAERLAATSQHPVVVGGPHADTLVFIAETLVPDGYRIGLWQARRGTAAHAIRPVTFGVAEARCGTMIHEPRRADPSLSLCRRCFPS